jgi:hypothetical protein
MVRAIGLMSASTQTTVATLWIPASVGMTEYFDSA